MLVVISPAKRLDWAERDVQMTAPAMQEDAVRLARTARNLTLGKLKSLMDLSDDLARLNRDRFKAYSAEPQPEDLRAAAWAFAGDTYQGLDAPSLDSDGMAWAQEHLRILSGLYGVLRPMDGIQPYRLEMGSKLKTRRGSSLYEYWRDQLSKSLNAQAQALGTQTLVNCASQEYFGAVKPDALKLTVITPQFLEVKDGTAKMVSFFAKKARGSMARYVIDFRLTDPEALKDFDYGGYAYDPERSSEHQPVFTRPYAAAS